MNTQLYKKQFFSANKTAELAGISKSQFDNFKASGLIEYKHRYSLNEVVYISFTNSFRIHGFKWTTILNFYNDVFKDLDNTKSLDFLNNDVLFINEYKDNNGEKYYEYLFKSKNDPLTEMLLQIQIVFKDVLAKEKLSTPIICNNFCHAVKTVDGMCEIYSIFLYKIVEEIILKSKELDLKVDVESILKSA